ncbi:hypothetical protein SAMN04515671_1054 [Nakamurella panacisegetis]|uniref:Uncharacterized protein n=1 Tax=Nakamurella panacisegetis TaxID=1090615 RepID=A0A1H0JV99_9ACTN|nr:hypothetical protein [Nakamurella panacisegetis]SDO47479.1 hypothetical protein SAMN04515671_1054 [Nakamurella panacisegetis]
MKRWIRIGTVAVAGAIALAVGLSSASAGSPTPPAAPPTASGGHTPAFQADPHTVRPAKSETLFYPVTPCRIIDTRSGGGFLNDNVPRSFYVTGTLGFLPQGGTGGGCGIPAGATGITTNVTATNATMNGYLTGYPTGATPPHTNFISTHPNLTLTANPTFALAAGNNKPLTITNHLGKTQLIVDVTGYYIPQIEGLVTETSTPYNSTSRILSSVRNSTGSFTVTVDSDVTYCTPIVTPYFGTGIYGSAYAFNTNKVQVYLWTLSNTGQPVPSDGTGYFYLTVVC